MSSEIIIKITPDEFRAKEKIEGDSVLDDDARQERKDLLVRDVKPRVLEYLSHHHAPDWLKNVLRNSTHLEDILSNMRHIEGGQIFFLKLLLEKNPNLIWYRGGTETKWKDLVAPKSREFFTQDELETTVIDGGANGVFDRPSLALQYLKMAVRNKPAIHALTLPDLLEGIETNALKLISEHQYDLRVIPEDKNRYLAFCKDHLKTYEISM